MIKNFFKFPESSTIVSKKGLRGITDNNIGTGRNPYLEFQYDNAYIRVYFNNDDELFMYYHSLIKELLVEVVHVMKV